MALPIIRINSSTGSDTAASGAGPISALTGSAASTSADGLTVTLDGSPDLSGVATDGSHVIFLNDPTAGARNFGKIVGKDQLLYTVTVSDAFRSSATGLSWAIGGKRASIGATTSRKLFDNNSAAGDAMPGWIIEMEDGHAESLGSTGIVMRRAGDATNGAITLRGASGASVLPKITYMNNSTGIAFSSASVARWLFEDFHVEKNATGGSHGGYAFNCAGFTTLRRIKVTDVGTTHFIYGIVGTGSTIAIGCYVENATVIGIHQCNTFYCFVRNCATGINMVNNADIKNCIGNIIYNPTTTGINIANYSYNKLVLNNTVYANTGSPNGISFDATSTGAKFDCFFFNNAVVGCATAFVITGTSPDNAAELLAKSCIFDSNAIYNCTNQITSGYESLLTNTVTTDPQFSDPASGDFSVGENMRAVGLPTFNIGYSATRSYVDIGAAQRQETSGVGVRGRFNGAF